MSIDTQNTEFSAVAELAKQYRRITMTPVVDDDYPEVRHAYETALGTLIESLKGNGRLTEKTLLAELLRAVGLEVDNAIREWPPMNSAHEGFAVIAEEVDELWDHIKTKQRNRDLVKMEREAIQVAAMAVRFALEVCGEERGRK